MVEIIVEFSDDIALEMRNLLSRFTKHIISTWVAPGLSTSNLTWTIQVNSNSKFFVLTVNHNNHMLLSLEESSIARITDSHFETLFHNASLKYGSR